jgi:hypothetical protein
MSPVEREEHPITITKGPKHPNTQPIFEYLGIGVFGCLVTSCLSPGL